MRAWSRYVHVNCKEKQVFPFPQIIFFAQTPAAYRGFPGALVVLGFLDDATKNFPTGLLI